MCRVKSQRSVYTCITRYAVACVLSMLISTPVFAGEIYRWLDADGKLHMSDRAPAHIQAETLQLNPHTISSVPDNSPTTQQKAKKKSSKVVLYSTEWCGYCKLARQYFKDNNIRFTEYDVEKNSRGKRDFKRLRGVSVPIILIGDNSRMNGFSEQRFEQNWAYVNSQ